MNILKGGRNYITQEYYSLTKNKSKKTYCRISKTFVISIIISLTYLLGHILS
jgi:hypothetical protein